MHQNYETLGPVANDVILINHLVLARGDCFREKMSNGSPGSTIFKVVSIINDKNKTGQLIGGRPLFFQDSMATSYFVASKIYYPLSAMDRENILAYEKELDDLRKSRAEQKEKEKIEESIFKMEGCVDSELDTMNSDYTPPPVRQDNGFSIIHVPRPEHPNNKFFTREFFGLP